MVRKQSNDMTLCFHYAILL